MTTTRLYAGEDPDRVNFQVTASAAIFLNAALKSRLHLAVIQAYLPDEPNLN